MRILILLLISANVLFAQEVNQTKLIKQYGIRGFEIYSFGIEDNHITTDSTLISIIKLNKKGFVTQTVVFDSLTLKERHEFEYENDTLLIRHRVYVGHVEGGPRVTNVYEYNDDGKMKTEKNFSFAKRISQNIYKYDKRNRLKYKITQVLKHNKTKQRYIYNKKNQLKKIRPHAERIPVTKMEYNSLGQHVRTFSHNFYGKKTLRIEYEYDSQGRLKRQIKHNLFKSNTFVEGVTAIKKSDVLIKEFVFFENGLIKRENNYLTAKLIWTVKYKYVQ